MKRYFYKVKNIITIKVLTASISIVGIAAIPYITKMLIDYNFSKGSKGVIIFILMYILAVTVGMSFEYISQLHAWKLERKFNLLIKRDIFNSIINYDYKKFADSDIGTYISVLDNDVKVIESQYIESIVGIAQSAIQLVIYAIYMFALDPRIAVVIILCSSLSFFLPNITSKTLSQRRGQQLNAIAAYIEKIKDLLEGFKNINLYTRKNILEEHNKAMHDAENKLLHYGRFSTFTNILNGSFMYLLDIAAFATIAVLLLKSEISVGTATATLGYITSFIYPIRYILQELSNIKSTKSTREKILSFVNVSKTPLGKLKEFKSSIKFSNVSITFDDFELKNISYTFEKGKKYAIVGHSGSGKSTILNLIMKYIKPTEGKVLIDGIDINDIEVEGLVGCVNQVEHIFSTSFSNNVTVFGSYSDSKLESIIDYFKCDKLNLISNKDDCTKLSGGEKQLLYLVKMLLINRDIIILDEPFSALDIQNTLLMQDKVYGLKDKTMIAVTHNLSQSCLKYFDEVIIMSNGHIEKIGSMKEIIKSEEYNKLVMDIA